MAACPARLWGDLDGLACQEVSEHVTHWYVASAVGDAHDVSEQRAEDAR